MTQEEIDRAWFKEIRRRWVEYERGTVKALSMDQVMVEAQQRLRRRRPRRALRRRAEAIDRGDMRLSVKDDVQISVDCGPAR